LLQAKGNNGSARSSSGKKGREILGKRTTTEKQKPIVRIKEKGPKMLSCRYANEGETVRDTNHRNWGKEQTGAKCAEIRKKVRN